MTEQEYIEEYYQSEAKRVVNLMFDSKIFREDFTRDNMQSIEDLIAYYFQSIARSTRKSTEILLSLKK